MCATMQKKQTCFGTQILGARWQHSEKQQWSNGSHDKLMSKSQVTTDRGQQLFQNMINVIIKTKLYQFYNMAGGEKVDCKRTHVHWEN